MKFITIGPVAYEEILKLSCHESPGKKVKNDFNHLYSQMPMDALGQRSSLFEYNKMELFEVVQISNFRYRNLSKITLACRK